MLRMWYKAFIRLFNVYIPIRQMRDWHYDYDICVEHEVNPG